MHRSLQVLQYYTSHSQEDISRLHQRIHSSLTSTESLTDTMIRLTGSAPLVPFEEDTVTAAEWNAFLQGKHHEVLADFLALLVSRPILEEDGPVIAETEEPLPTLSRSYREPSARRKRDDSNVSHTKKRLPWGWLALLLLCFLLGAAGTYVYSNYFVASKSTPESTVEQPVTVNKSETKQKKKEKATPTEEATSLYINQRNSNIYTDESMTTVLYEADFGDQYPIVKKLDGNTQVKVTDQLSGYVKTAETTTKLTGDPITDEALVSWVTDNLNTQFVEGSITDLMGKSSEDLTASFGPPNRTYQDDVYSYLFYATHFFILDQNRVVAIDWTDTSITNDQLANLAPLQLETDTTGLVTSNSYRLQRFAKDGTVSRVRLAEQSF